MTVKTKEKLTLVEVLHQDIAAYTDKEFKVAKGYDPVSAVQSAVYALEQVQAPGGGKALAKVSSGSVKNAVRQMVTMGLYPDKKQGYFIAYGDQMTFMPSYMGYQMILKRDYDVKEVMAVIVYKTDKIQTQIVNGQEQVIPGSHIRGASPFDTDATKLENVVGAYAIAVLRNGKEKHEIMNIAQINKAWSKAKTKNVQQDFWDQMIKRTILNRLAKGILTSDIDENARLAKVAQAIYDADGYDYDETNPLDVNVAELNMREVDAFDEEETETGDDFELDIIHEDSIEADPF